MKVDVTVSNPALVSIFENPNQIITLDANFLIPPDRSRYGARGFKFEKFREIWLEPVFCAFSNIAIHEAVYGEIVAPMIKTYIDTLLNKTPPVMIIHKDSTLTEVENILRDSIESKIYPYTNYEPMLDNKDDRGEVKSLSYIAVKNLLYFAAHDNNAIQLVEKSEEWLTGLDNVKAIKMYELIYYLYSKNFGDSKSLRMLYKYQYYLTDNEKRTNPEWRVFKDKMNELYLEQNIGFEMESETMKK